MTRLLSFAALASIAALAGLPTLAQDTPTAADLIRKAIDAHGGRAALASLPDLEMTGTLELFGRFAGSRYDLVNRERTDGAYRREVLFEFRGGKFNVIEFYDGAVRKRRFRTSWDDLPTVEADEAAAHRLGMLLTLDPSEATVDGEGSEDDRPVWLVSVPDGRGRAVLALDEETGHVLAIEYPGTKAEGLGTKEDVQRKLVYRDFRPVGDLVLAFDIASSEDESPTSRIRYETIVTLDDFDTAWLRVPDPTRRFIPSEELAF